MRLQGPGIASRASSASGETQSQEPSGELRPTARGRRRLPADPAAAAPEDPSSRRVIANISVSTGRPPFGPGP